MITQRYRDRYSAHDAMTDEERTAARALTNASWIKTFPEKRYVDAGSDLILTTGNGSGPKLADIDTRTPGMVEAWRRRIEKARREIERHTRETDIRMMAESITDEQLHSDIEVIRQWANSLRKLPK